MKIEISNGCIFIDGNQVRHVILVDETIIEMPVPEFDGEQVRRAILADRIAIDMTMIEFSNNRAKVVGSNNTIISIGNNPPGSTLNF